MDLPMPEPEPSDEEIQRVYTNYGIAMYWAQAVEQELGILLAAVFNPKFAASSACEMERAFASEFSKTLGQLVKKLQAVSPVEPDLEDRLRKSVDTRNWLAHRYFGDRSAHFLTKGGRDFILKELSAISDELQSLNDALCPITASWMERTKVPRSILEREWQRLLDESKSAGSGA